MNLKKSLEKEENLVKSISGAVCTVACSDTPSAVRVTVPDSRDCGISTEDVQGCIMELEIAAMTGETLDVRDSKHAQALDKALGIIKSDKSFVSLYQRVKSSENLKRTRVRILRHCKNSENWLLD